MSYLPFPHVIRQRKYMVRRYYRAHASNCHHRLQVSVEVVRRDSSRYANIWRVWQCDHCGYYKERHTAHIDRST